MSKRLLRLALLLFAGLAFTRCAGLGYYAQAVGGQLELMRAREPIPRLVTDPATDPELKQRLGTVLAMRRFAVAELALPGNGSYGSYADLGRPYAVWTVVAAPELSLEPRRWCFPVAGCVSYRGYFSRRRAERFAERLAARGDDVEVAGRIAYSTLGWLRDPVLNTFITLPEADLAGLLFHELAHQVVYVGDDTTFNESFATAVEREGVRRWLTARGRGEELAAYRRAQRREEEVLALLLAFHERLAAVYTAARPDAWKRARKEEVFAELGGAYRRLAASWGDAASPWDAWFAAGLDNASLASVGPYYEQVPAFEELLARAGGDLGDFYTRVEELARRPAEERRRRLEELAAGAAARG